MTSLAFMLLLVPDPVWNTSIGKCASWRPVGHLQRRPLDGEGPDPVEITEFEIGPSRRPLDEPERPDEARAASAGR